MKNIFIFLKKTLTSRTKKYSNPSKYKINYIYFGLIFLFLIFITFSHFLSLEQIAPYSKFYYFVYSLVQGSLELFFIILLGIIIKKTLPNLFHHFFVGICFILFLVQFVNFIMLCLMDSTVSYAFANLFSEGIKDIFVTLRAINLKPTMLIIISAAILAIPILGIILYHFTFKLSKIKPLSFSLSSLTKTIYALCISLLITDFFITSHLNPTKFHFYEKRLPFCSSLIRPSHKKINFKKSFIPLANEKKIHKKIDQIVFPNIDKPNIFIFVIESLRNDFITPTIAPNIYKFKENNLSFDLCLSSANATHLSWYSIFYSKFPFYWNECKKKWKKGSVALHLLKKLKYKINVLSSTELEYFKMDKVLFGKKHEIADSFIESYSHGLVEAYKRDSFVMDKLNDYQQKEGNFFAIFLDSTHSEYSWPTDFPIKFTPICNNINYLSISQSRKGLEEIKNRYRNSIFFIDSLIGKFIKNLKEKKIFDNSIIIITGDHGEEFFEQGSLFHGTILDHYQTNVPLYYKFPTSPPKTETKIASHIDIFPSIFHYLFKQELFFSFFDGQSIFSKKRWPYALCVKQSCGHTPHEFYIHNGKEKIYAQFPSNKIFTENEIEIISIKDNKDKIISTDKSLERYIKDNFPKAWDKLFITPH
jgi:hypothetical protein